LLEDYFKKGKYFVTAKLAGLNILLMEIGGTGTRVLFQEHVTILEAIANSGDIAITGNKQLLLFEKHPQVLMHDIDLTDINVMKSPYFYLQPNDYIYVKPLKQKTWGTGKTGIESIGTLVSLLSLATTTYFLLFKIKNLFT
jgi:polysaccharide export outer membrane protein